MEFCEHTVRCNGVKVLAQHMEPLQIYLQVFHMCFPVYLADNPMSVEFFPPSHRHVSLHRAKWLCVALLQLAPFYRQLHEPEGLSSGQKTGLCSGFRLASALAIKHWTQIGTEM